MKRCYLVLALCGLFVCLMGCAQGKSGPFTFTNRSGETVSVLITQDKTTVARSFANGETYTGADYYTPTITFVKGIDTEENRQIADNRYAAATANGFDYDFVKAEGQKLVIYVSLGGDFSTNESLKDSYLVEASGKMGDYSDTTVKLADIQNSTLFTPRPEFLIFSGATPNQDITDLFTLALGQETINGTVTWELEITYPKVVVIE